jgi:hypothetical protein
MQKAICGGMFFAMVGMMFGCTSILQAFLVIEKSMAGIFA